ncbi:MAG: carboxymuconolactone decarboxylase family protein [Pseudomonadota bacterium]
MARIPLFPLDSMTAEQRRVYDAVVSGPRGVVVGPLRAALHRPELADKWQQFGEILRYRTSLPPRLSELAILVTARHWTSQLEWQQHAPAALKGGLSAAVIEAIRHGQRPPFTTEDEQAIYDFCREMHENKAVSDKSYRRAHELIGTLGVVELTALMGYYTMVAMTLIAHEIPLPEGAAPALPPRAR